ncbi:3-hydroxyacyl-CoA dehydrogenase [Aspergillus alliaceus]|uniref:3-hydroxyacyl-CoA dehydrogenase n=1 Tax=Petromyces alliaceus TaxID=209559 RepID=A0A5N7CAF8_PETAA|nr:3-hydroxyacyl-CoA dehydrogenase [Aspergillus alliaceus]
MPWKVPMLDFRPVVVLGAGILGRRIACTFVAAGYNVHIYDISNNALNETIRYIDENMEKFTTLSKIVKLQGSCSVFTNFEAAVPKAWLVIEAIPEILELKSQILGVLDRIAPEDCIFASNSSSFKSSLMLGEVSKERRRLVLNAHFYMPPNIRIVELMTDGETQSEIFPFLSGVLESCGMIPVIVRVESTGFIFNRLWASIKREILFILAEGVSEPKQIDLLWRHMFKSTVAPCELMDDIGLDTVALVEDNYIAERQLDGRMTVDWLRDRYLSHGKVGKKSINGGLYHPSTNTPSSPQLCLPDISIYIIDVGSGGNLKDMDHQFANGRLVRFTPVTNSLSTLISGLNAPDGIDISSSIGKLFWTNTGHLASVPDGSIMSARLDGRGAKTLICDGQLYTPKQLVVEDNTQTLYFCDREGMSVHRCGFYGQSHEILIKRGEPGTDDRYDMTRWCVGVAVDAKAGKIYWTQKGPGRGYKGCIYRTNIETPLGQTAEARSDIETIFEGLPEPIDLALDVGEGMLYWTDRGELPRGCSLNRAYVGGGGYSETQEHPDILARHFDQPIGLKLDLKWKKIYVADLGGSLYRLNLDGSGKETLIAGQGAYAGITLFSRCS